MAWTDTTRKAIATGQSDPGSVTLNSTAAGSLIVVGVAGWSDNVDTTAVVVSDGTNGNYTPAFFLTNGALFIALSFLPNNAGGNLSISANPNGSSDIAITIMVHEFSGGDTVSPLSGTPATNTGNSSTLSSGSFTPPENDVLLVSVGTTDTAPILTLTENAGSEGFTLSNENETVYQCASMVFKIISGSPGSVSHSWNCSGTQIWSAGIAAFKIVGIIEQEGFRFRNDDGSETGATWKDSENTNLSGAAGKIRVRVTLNITGDPAAIVPQWEVRIKPSGGSYGAWKRIT